MKLSLPLDRTTNCSTHEKSDILCLVSTSLFVLRAVVESIDELHCDSVSCDSKGSGITDSSVPAWFSLYIIEANIRRSVSSGFELKDALDSIERSLPWLSIERRQERWWIGRRPLLSPMFQRFWNYIQDKEDYEFIFILRCLMGSRSFKIWYGAVILNMCPQFTFW